MLDLELVDHNHLASSGMERAGLGVGVGVVALAKLFNNVVDSYGYVRLGKCYPRDFETSQTKLDLSRLQLSRWEEALGLNAPVAETTRLPSVVGSADDVIKAKEAPPPGRSLPGYPEV